MRRPPSWKTIRNRWNQHAKELRALAAKHRGKTEVYGRFYTITGKFSNDADCNAWLAKHPEHGLIKQVPWPAKDGAAITLYTARLDDTGSRL